MNTKIKVNELERNTEKQQLEYGVLARLGFLSLSNIIFTLHSLYFIWVVIGWMIPNLNGLHIATIVGNTVIVLLMGHCPLTSLEQKMEAGLYHFEGLTSTYKGSAFIPRALPFGIVIDFHIVHFLLGMVVLSLLNFCLS